MRLGKWWMASMLVLAACTRPRTQLVPVVSSDLTDAQIQCVLAEAARVTSDGTFTPIDSPHLFYVHRDGLPAVSLPFSFGLLPPGDDMGVHIELRVSALSVCDENDPSVRTVTRVVRTGFVRDESRSLPVFLSSRCVGVTCADGMTCEEGVCVAVPDIVPETLTRVGHPGDELDGGGVDVGARDTGVDAGADAGSAGLPGPGTLAATLTPAWALSSGTLFDFPADFGMVGLAGEDVIVGARTDSTGTFAGTAIAASSIVLARLHPDGSPAWVHTFSTPATGLQLQSFGVSSAVLVTQAGTPRLFVCGAVGQEGMTDAMSGQTWTAPTGTLLPTDAWIASFDPNTGALGRVVTVHATSSASVDTFCSLTTRTGAEVVAVLRPFNGPGSVSALTWNAGEGTIPLAGGPYGTNFGVLVELDPRFDAAPTGVLATTVTPLPGASALEVAPDGNGGLIVAGAGFTEPGAPLSIGTPRVGPTLDVVRMASDGSVTWRTRVLGTNVYANVGGLSVSDGHVFVSVRSSVSMTTGTHAYQVGDTGTLRTLAWSGAEAWNILVALDLAGGASMATHEVQTSGPDLSASDGAGEVLVVGAAYDGADFGSGAYVANGAQDMVLLRFHADLTLASDTEWTSTTASSDRLLSTLITPGGLLYVSGATSTGGTVTLAPGVTASGAFVTRM